VATVGRDAPSFILAGKAEGPGNLERIPGIAKPTATCLLTALWPDSHATMDVRDRRAAIGLHVGRLSHREMRLDTAWIPSDQWWFYDWFRRTVPLTAAAAECEPVVVERALYVLGVAVARDLGAEWHGKWSEYRRVAVTQVNRLTRRADATP
jgi:hypothetical protein